MPPALLLRWETIQINAKLRIVQLRAAACGDVRAPAVAHLPGVASVGEILPLVALLDEDRPGRSDTIHGILDLHHGVFGRRCTPKDFASASMGSRCAKLGPGSETQSGER